MFVLCCVVLAAVPSAHYCVVISSAKLVPVFMWLLSCGACCDQTRPSVTLLDYAINRVWFKT